MRQSRRKGIAQLRQARACCIFEAIWWDAPLSELEGRLRQLVGVTQGASVRGLDNTAGVMLAAAGRGQPALGAVAAGFRRACQEVDETP